MRGVTFALVVSGLAIGITLAGVRLPARAADTAAATKTDEARTDENKTADGWIVTLRAIGAVGPSFPGSGKLDAYPFPSIGFRRMGTVEAFSAPDDSFGLTVVDFGPLRVGPVASFVFKRGQRDGLLGLHTVGLTYEVGGFVEFAPNDHVRTRAELRQGIGGHHGFVAALGADVYGSTGPVTASIGPRLGFGDNRYARAYFSVTALEAALSGRLAPYQASGGFISAGGMATLRYDFTADANVAVFAGLQTLTGSVGSSPIPNTIGSRNQFTAGLSIARSFEIRSFW